jgi:hypothetical protein
MRKLLFAFVMVIAGFMWLLNELAEKLKEYLPDSQ